jgi:uncharacterized phage protein (predicted DNA packaging)
MSLIGVKITDLDLEFVKEYLKVDYEDEDATIQMLILAAKSYIETILGFKIEKEWTTSSEIPDELTVAALMIIAHWFDHRQMQTTGTLGDEIRFAVTALTEAHKIPFKDYDETETTSDDSSTVVIG